MVATQLRSRKVLGLNQRQFQGLKTALQLNLRRQLLIAVCDSETLQQQLVSRLQDDLSVADATLDDFGSVSLAQLTFDPHQPDLMLQLVQWLKQAPKPTPHLQVVGLEAMTHQPMRSQNHFLRSLEGIQALLPYLESTLVLWLSWPWYRTLQQSAPEFWSWRSGVFTFVGEPVPIVPDPAVMPPAEDGLYGDAPTVQNADIWQILSEDLAQLDQAPEATDTIDQAAVQLPRPSLEALEQVEQSPVSADELDQIAQALDKDELDQIAQTVDKDELDQTAQTVNEHTIDQIAQPVPPSETLATVDVTTLNNPLETLAQLEDQGATPEEITHAYRALGNHYRDRIEAGEMTPDLLELAIKTFEIYLKWLPTDDDQRAAGLNDWGTLCWLQAQQQSDRSVLIQGMNRSAELYQEGLSCAEIEVDTASRLHGNLGAVYSALANYDDPATHLKNAITAYCQALPFCSIESSPDEYGTLQNSLGSVYWKLAYYEQPQSHLNQAIAAYNEALRCHHPETSPLEYAAVQNNLGIAYWSLSRYERPIFLLKHSIAAYRDALNYRTPTVDAAACASTYNNLGTAFWELANHPDTPAETTGRYKQNAVIAYEAALKASELAPSSLAVVSIRHCLGSIYDKLARSAAHKDVVRGNLERALTHYIAALELTPKTAVNYESIFKSLVRNIAAHYELLGLEGQQAALNHVPAELLPEVMLKL
ncbi:MAG: tetratricopeptide repeat protein [Leptolyngbyaceae cyanobacterium MAG.088]|nr:tetratricopeptide repeat protein [Leptolyngbyaceae cyanobacterium MAG.088]